MPKKRKSKASKSQSSVQTPQNSRNRTLRAVSIWIILALVLTFLAGALSFTPSSAKAASVPILAANSAPVDTDGDGIENNLDPDVDGDGVANGEDDDIDGDGIANFDDADPIDTTDIDSNAPQKPIRPPLSLADCFRSTAWIWISSFMVLASIFAAWISARKRKKNR